MIVADLTKKYVVTPCIFQSMCFVFSLAEMLTQKLQLSGTGSLTNTPFLTWSASPMATDSLLNVPVKNRMKETWPIQRRP